MSSQNNLRGMLFMLLAVSFLSVMDSIVKTVLSKDLPVIQLIAVRGWIIILVLLIALPFRGGWQTLATKRIKHHLWRTVIGFFAPLCFFISLKYLPIADATAIFFCTSFFMTAGSVVFLGEKVGIHRWAAVFFGFLGVVIVASPGTESFHPAAILPICAGLAYAILLLSGRHLSRTESSFKLIFYFTAFNTLITSILLPFFWVPISMEILQLLVLISALALSGYFFLTHAITIAPLGVIAPIEYTSLVWATLLGYLIWQEIPSSSAWLGMGIILASGLYLLWRENRASADKFAE